MTQVRPGDDREADYGPMTLPGQAEVIEKHIADALARGGRPVVGGIASIRRPYVGPVILADVPEESQAVTEETFGPTITVAKVASLAEGVELANASRYGLGGTVFAGNKKAAMAAARSLRSGMTAINSVISFASVPSLPFGGSGDSGFGRIHGADGLREFARPKSIARQRMKPLVNLTSFSRTDAGHEEDPQRWPRCCTAGATSSGRPHRRRMRGPPGEPATASAAAAQHASRPGPAAASGARPWMRSAARSAIAIVGALVLPRGTVGITEASTTRSRSTPRTRSSVSTHAGQLAGRQHGSRRPSRRCRPGGRSW